MFRQSIERVTNHDVLARTVFDGLGRPLLKAGTPLARHYVEALRERGILTVFIQDGLADDVAPTDALSEQVRTRVTGHVAAAFEAVAELGVERGVVAGDIDGTVERLGEGPLDLGDQGEQLVARLHQDVEDLLNELLEAETIAGLESLKTHNEYTFQHSVDVAVMGALIGRQLGMPRQRLHHLALGCLLHDIGKIYIDAAILDKPGSLDPAERALIEEHPRMGFEVCRRLPVGSILPAHVAFQHHERQDGRGYPRGLAGNNQIGPRLDTEAVGSRQMLLIAEIAGVADVYSALTSDRPYRGAMAPDTAVDTLRSMSSTHLNREVLSRLLRIVPPYPIGHWVTCVQGRLSGWRGVVSAVNARDIARPTVRFLIDDAGNVIDSPHEVPTEDEPDMMLQCLEWPDS